MTYSGDDEIDISHIYKFIDLMMGYRRDRIAEILSGSGTIEKVQAANEIIAIICNEMIPDSVFERTRNQIFHNLMAEVDLTYFTEAKNNGGK